MHDCMGCMGLLSSYTMSSNGLLGQGRIDQNLRDLLQGMQLVDQMAAEGVAHDAATWLTLLSGARYLGRPDVAELVRIQIGPLQRAWGMPCSPLG